MITKFANVYAGHVDLGDMGQGATPANERRYSNEHLTSVFEKTEAIARCMAPKAAMLDQLAWLGKEVLPEFHNGR